MLYVLLRVILVHITSMGVFSQDIEEYCPVGRFEPSCAHNQVIVMTQALYGTMKVGKCIGEHFSMFVGCETDELKYFDQQCSGKQSCTVSVPDETLSEKLECLPKGMSPYLEAGYNCLTVLTEDHKCNTPRKIQITSSYTMISSVISRSSLCGQHSTPYVLEGKPGQNINISLLDFSWQIDAASNNEEECLSYGYILNTKNNDVKSICGRTKRQKHIYTSIGSSVQILFESSVLDYNQFILQVKAVGCPDVNPPKHGWIQREGGLITLGCYSNSKTWQLKCVDNNWLGGVDGCDAPDQTTEEPTYMKIPNMVAHDDGDEDKAEVISLNRSLSISRNHILVVSVGCFTLISCCVVVITGIYCIRKYQKQSHEAGLYVEYTPYNPIINGTIGMKSATENHMMHPESKMMLPPYLFSLPRNGNDAPDVPQRNPPLSGGGMGHASEIYDSNSVKYYVLENPAEKNAQC